MLQDHSVVDEADVLGGIIGLGALLAQEMQDASGQHSKLAVLDEFTQVGQPRLLALCVLLDDADDAVHDGPLVLKATLQWEGSTEQGGCSHQKVAMRCRALSGTGTVVQMQNLDTGDLACWSLSLLFV